MKVARTRFFAILLLAAGACLGYFIYASQIPGTPFSGFPFKRGLDLSGGTHLVYRADTSAVPAGEVGDSMEALRDVIERRVNLFGVSEPLVQIERGGTVGTADERLIVELPGVTDTSKAVALIGQTPTLDFKLVRAGMDKLTREELGKKTFDEVFVTTGLTGRFLTKAQVIFDSTSGQPKVALTFNKEGGVLFAKITRANIGKPLAIFLDNQPIETPVIQQEISDGTAEITGGFTLEKARDLARNLNYGALPVPIELISTQTVGASLGQAAVSAGVYTGILAFIIISLFLVLWYRVPGILAVISLALYTALNLVIFKLIPVTLTAAGIAGFILSLGMAVDANILIFERTKEELKRGKELPEAIREGFARAWLSIRDSNLSSIITAVILYTFASTAIIKGFALVFGIGVVVSMFTAITASRTFLLALGVKGRGAFTKFLFKSGISF
jgi:protein-export membrane protein SecD